VVFAFNDLGQPQALPLDPDTSLMRGSSQIKPHGVTVWRASGN